jgi:hypothetical protein
MSLSTFSFTFVFRPFTGGGGGLAKEQGEPK